MEFCTQPGLRTSRQAPHVVISVKGYRGRQSRKALARIDTGADISCIPIVLFRQVAPVPLSLPVLIKDHIGRQRKHQRLIMDIILWDGNRVYDIVRPPRGVLVREGDGVGLIGMDVLRHFRLEGEGRDWKLIPRKEGSFPL